MHSSEQELHLANMRPHVLLVEVLDRHKVKLIPRLALNGPPDLKIEAYVPIVQTLTRKVVFDLAQLEDFWFPIVITAAAEQSFFIFVCGFVSFCIDRGLCSEDS